MRYLFGPVSNEFATDNLAAARADGSCLAFDFGPGADLAVSAEDPRAGCQFAIGNC
jgi:hypothetical protein